MSLASPLSPNVSHYLSAERLFLEGTTHYANVTPSLIERLTPSLNPRHIDVERFYMLGICHLHGYGTEPDKLLAEGYLKVAAQRKHAASHYLLTLLFRGAWSTDRYSHLLHHEHLLGAAHLGHTIAQMEVGDMHMEGHHYEGSGPRRAKTYYQQAASKGFKPALAALHNLKACPKTKAAAP